MKTTSPEETIKRLFEWSHNYDGGNNPYCVYLDLIGYSEAYYGETVSYTHLTLPTILRV